MEYACGINIFYSVKKTDFVVMEQFHNKRHSISINNSGTCSLSFDEVSLNILWQPLQL